MASVRARTGKTVRALPLSEQYLRLDARRHASLYQKEPSSRFLDVTSGSARVSHSKGSGAIL